MPKPAPDADRLLEVGRVGKAHGLKGDVIVHLSTDREERVEPGTSLRSAEGRTLTVRRSQPHANGFIVGFGEVHGRNQAEALRGDLLFAEPLDDPDAIWVHDLIGSSVVELNNGTERGTVVEVQANPASDLLVTDQGALIPLTFMVEQRGATVVVDVPAGLFDLFDEA